MKHTLLILITLASTLTACNTKTNSANDPVLTAVISDTDSARFSAYYSLLDSLKLQVYSKQDKEAVNAVALKDAKALLAKAKTMAEGKTDMMWIWDDANYMVVRSDLGVVFDILGYMDNKEAKALLNEGLTLKDNNLKLFAVTSLLRLHENVPAQAIEEVAADPEDRLWLCRNLLDMGKQELFPAKYNTQPMLAEADMVQWLIYPTELARVPDEIKLEKTIIVEDNSAPVQYFLFKFMSKDALWADKGWMAGVAGPYVVSEQPTPYDQGGTFSNFKSWDSLSAEGHLEELTGTVKAAWKNYEKTGQTDIETPKPALKNK